AASCARAGRVPPTVSASRASQYRTSRIDTGRPARAAGWFEGVIDVLLGRRSVAQEKLFDRQFVQLGDAKRERQRGIVIARLAPIHALPRDPEMVSQALPAPPAFAPQNAEAVLPLPVALTHA